MGNVLDCKKQDGLKTMPTA